MNAPINRPYSLPPRRALGDHPLAAVVFVLAAVLIFSTQDMCTKLLVVDYSPVEIAWFRYVINALVLLPFVLRSPGRVFYTSRLPLQLGRGLAMLASALIFMAGLGYLPIADATAINFVSPLLVIALSIPLLGEQVGVRRWAAVIVGFIGALVIIRPGTAYFDPAALIPLASATCWGLTLVLTRRIKGSASALTTLVYSTLVGILILSALLPFVWRLPTVRAGAILLAVGVISVAGQYLLILGYLRRPASVLAPLIYTQIIWSTLYGALIFGSVPGPATWLGGAIVVASGLYVLHRERAIAGRSKLDEETLIGAPEPPIV